MPMERKTRKVLILKTGYTETLCDEPYKEGNVSLGDVLRTTALLHLYKKDKVTWLTDTKAVPLLEGCEYIDRILEFNLSSILQLTYEHFDIVINLEKNPGLCALANNIESWQKYGFRFDAETGTAEGYNGAIDALYMAKDECAKLQDTNHWLVHLFAMVGHLWTNARYCVGSSEGGIDVEHKIVGLNWKVGTKFNGKSWGDQWHFLRYLLEEEGITYSMQPEMSTLNDYINWIKAHTMIVTCDSLGLHLAMAHSKRVVGLFGPSRASEIQPYLLGRMIQKESMGDIKPEEVFEAVKELLEWGTA